MRAILQTKSSKPQENRKNKIWDRDWAKIGPRNNSGGCYFEAAKFRVLAKASMDRTRD